MQVFVRAFTSRPFNELILSTATARIKKEKEEVILGMIKGAITQRKAAAPSSSVATSDLERRQLVPAETKQSVVTLTETTETLGEHKKKIHLPVFETLLWTADKNFDQDDPNVIDVWTRLNLDQEADFIGKSKEGTIHVTVTSQPVQLEELSLLTSVELLESNPGLKKFGTVKLPQKTYKSEASHTYEFDYPVPPGMVLPTSSNYAGVTETAAIYGIRAWLTDEGDTKYKTVKLKKKAKLQGEFLREEETKGSTDRVQNPQ